MGIYVVRSGDSFESIRKGGVFVKKILLPVDVSGLSDKTFETALLFAEKLDAMVILLNVIKESEIVETSFSGIHAYDTYYNDITLYNKYYAEERSGLLYKISDQVLSSVAKKFQKESIRTKTIIEYGHPSDQILAVSEEQACDLIIMPNKNESAIKTFFLGSNTDKVVHHSKIPVLVVK
jgi:nucleotide-binding universal stress UspA family protein